MKFIDKDKYREFIKTCHGKFPEGQIKEMKEDLVINPRITPKPIIKDLVRVCLFPEELQGKIRQNGRYILLVFDSDPSDYLAYSDRAWLECMLEDRNPKSTIDLQKEQKTIIKSVVNCDSINAQIGIKFSNFFFKPISQTFSSISRGYLLRIDSFDISINNSRISSSEDPREYWDSKKIEDLKSIKDEFIALLKGDEN